MRRQWHRLIWWVHDRRLRWRLCKPCGGFGTVETGPPVALVRVAPELLTARPVTVPCPDCGGTGWARMPKWAREGRGDG